MSFNAIAIELGRKLSEALELLIGTSIEVQVNSIQILDPVDAIPKMCRSYGEEVVAVYSNIKDKDTVLVLMDLETAKKFIGLFGPLFSSIDGSIAEDIMKEIGNQIIGATLSVIAHRYRVALPYSIPSVALDTCSSIVSEFLAYHFLGVDCVYLMDVEIRSRDRVSITIRLVLPMGF